MATQIEVTRQNSKGEKFMAKGPTAAELREENEELRSELESTQQALDEANDRLSQIYDLSAEEVEPEDFEEGEESDSDENGSDG